MFADKQRSGVLPVPFCSVKVTGYERCSYRCSKQLTNMNPGFYMHNFIWAHWIVIKYKFLALSKFELMNI